MHYKAVPTQPLLNMLFENWLQYYSQLQNWGGGGVGGGGWGGDWLYAFICKPVFQNCSGIFWNIIIYLYFSFFFLVDGSSMNSKWNLGNVIRWSMICGKILCICKSSIIVGGVSLSTFRILIDCIWIVDSNEKTLISPCSRVFGLDGS